VDIFFLFFSYDQMSEWKEQPMDVDGGGEQRRGGAEEQRRGGEADQRTSGEEKSVAEGMREEEERVRMTRRQQRKVDFW
jgi:hypothetical protein